MSVDYHEELQYVAVALVDREVYIYKAKQSGNKVGFHTIFSFRANLPNGATISTISVEKYVTNGKPILILGTFSGDVLIYWLTIDPEFEFLTEKQKLAERKEPKLFKKFNFFDKNLPRATKAEIDAHSNLGKQSRGISFKSQRLLGGPENAFVKKQDSSVSDYHNDTDVDQPSVRDNAPLLDPQKLVQDDYWNLFMHTRDKKAGPDGLYLLREVQQRVRNPKHT